jgi:DNA-binding transcriptional MerR regulator
MDHDVDLKGIQEVADLLSTTPRTLRFYEEKGLIRPLRIGAIRVYDRREIARIRLVLRGRRLGFSLTETARFLDLYDADPQHPDQLTALIERLRHRIVELRQQRKAIDQTLKELIALEEVALKRLASHEAVENVAQTSIAAAVVGVDSGPPVPPQSSAAHECEKIGIDDVRVRRRHAM